MTNKKIKYIILFFAFFIALSTKVNALKCEYSDGKLSAVFEINEKKNSVSKAKINGTLTSKDETKIEGASENVENWDSVFEPGVNPDEPKKININGSDYYYNNKKCPPFAVFVDRLGQFDFAVSTEDYLDQFKQYGKAKQGYAIMELIVKESSEVGTDNEYKARSCSEYTAKSSCENNKYFSCVWNETEYRDYCNTDNLMFVACGDVIDIPYQVPSLFAFFINLLKIATPIILIIVSIISLLKALAASNEDEIKKAQKSLIRKVIAAVMVFFVISIVQFIIFLVADDEIQSDYNNQTEVTNLSDCLNCLLNNNCQQNMYYRTNIGGAYYYYSVSTGEEILFDKEYYVSSNYYNGHINTDCESYGYFGEEDGYSDSYHPKAVKVNGACYTLTKTDKEIQNYTMRLTGRAKIYTQNLYSANGKCYYWEGRANKYIETSCDTEIVTAYYSGTKPTSCNGEYFDYSNTGKQGYQPKSILIDNTCYTLKLTEFKYVNRTTNLFDQSQHVTQKIWQANGKCYYWEGREMNYIEVECKNYN